MKLIKDTERKPCSDCGCAVGETHVGGCDHERCPKCGMQLIGCDCFIKNGEFDEYAFSKYEPEKWSGIFFEKEMKYCEEHNLFTKDGTHDINKAVDLLHRSH